MGCHEFFYYYNRKSYSMTTHDTRLLSYFNLMNIHTRELILTSNYIIIGWLDSSYNTKVWTHCQKKKKKKKRKRQKSQSIRSFKIFQKLYPILRVGWGGCEEDLYTILYMWGIRMGATNCAWENISFYHSLIIRSFLVVC